VGGAGKYFTIDKMSNQKAVIYSVAGKAADGRKTINVNCRAVNFNPSSLMTWTFTIGDVVSSLENTEYISTATASFSDVGASSLSGSGPIGHINGDVIFVDLFPGEWVYTELTCVLTNLLGETATATATITASYPDSSGMVIDHQTKPIMHIVNGRIKPQKILKSTFNTHVTDLIEFEEAVKKNLFAPGMELIDFYLPSHQANGLTLKDVPIQEDNTNRTKKLSLEGSEIKWFAPDLSGPNSRIVVDNLLIEGKSDGIQKLESFEKPETNSLENLRASKIGVEYPLPVEEPDDSEMKAQVRAMLTSSFGDAQRFKGDFQAASMFESWKRFKAPSDPNFTPGSSYAYLSPGSISKITISVNGNALPPEHQPDNYQQLADVPGASMQPLLDVINSEFENGLTPQTSEKHSSFSRATEENLKLTIPLGPGIALLPLGIKLSYVGILDETRTDTFSTIEQGSEYKIQLHYNQTSTKEAGWTSEMNEHKGKVVQKTWTKTKRLGKVDLKFRLTPIENLLSEQIEEWLELKNDALKFKIEYGQDINYDGSLKNWEFGDRSEISLELKYHF
jgi:hypothetical protein